jgi:DNA-binding MarR family transcriptional regulator
VQHGGDGAVSTDEIIHIANFRAALRRFLRQTEQAARRCGLTPQRHLLLLMVKGAPDGSERSTVSELAHRLQLAQSTVTELVTRAEDAGLLARRQSSDDARVTHVTLTSEGERRLGCAVSAMGEGRLALRDALREVAPRR